MIDALEPRRLLAEFNGTDGPDQIILQHNGDVIINGVKVGQGEAVTLINGNGGNDSISIFGTPSSFGDPPPFVDVHAGSGNDTITVASGDFDDDIDGEVAVYGDDGSDTVILNDQNDDNPDDYYLDNGGGFDEIWADEK